MDLNKVMIIGRLTRDPELRNIPSGHSVTSFGLATNRSWKGADGQKQDQVEFHNIVLWRRLAEVANQYLRKGSKVYIEGRLQTRDWTGKDGAQRRTTEIIGDSMIMLDSAPRNAGAGNNSVPTQQNEQSAPQEVIEEEVKVEDIPF